MTEKMNALRNKKGFTLIEMLVVVAIIAVLAAIAIPTVTSSTTKAKAAADAANLRSAMAEANIYALSEDLSPDEAKTFSKTEVSLVDTVSKQDGTCKLVVKMAAGGKITAEFTNSTKTITLEDCLEAAGETSDAGSNEEDKVS